MNVDSDKPETLEELYDACVRLSDQFAVLGKRFDIFRLALHHSAYGTVGIVTAWTILKAMHMASTTLDIVAVVVPWLTLTVLACWYAGLRYQLSKVRFRKKTLEELYERIRSIGDDLTLSKE